MEESRIRDVVAKPFGPYRDSLVLSNKCQTRGRESVKLSSLMMECGGTAIGFDETEFSIKDPKSRINSGNPVRFRGVVDIKHIDWLTDKGRSYLEYDIRKRDIDIHMHTTINPTSDLTLARIYRRDPVMRSVGGFTIKVMVQGEKGLPALYLSESLPHGLLFSSINEYRKYEVKSLDVETHSLSKNFFARYRLVALMHAIIASDTEDTDADDRTIDYFIDGYISRFAAGYEKKNLYRRLIYDSEDSDVDSDGNTTRKRMLRPVHNSDVRGLFAAHAEWILKDQLERKGSNFLNVRSWTQFCKEVKLNRAEARENGKRWGRAHGDESNADDSGSDIDFRKAGAFSEEALADLKRALERKNRKLTKPKKKGKRKGKQRATQIPPSDDDDDIVQDELMVLDNVIPDNTYDSDFSVPSSPPASASSDDDPETENPEIAALIPRQFWHPPQPPGLDFLWYCPAPECSYSINLLKLDAENTRDLDPATEAYLRGKRWRKMYDTRVMQGFYQMVSNHYNDHTEKLGIKWEHYCEKNGKLVWTNPKRHQPWPPSESILSRGGNIEMVKQEEEEEPVPTVGSSRTMRLRSL